MFIQTESDKKQVEFFKKYIPEIFALPNVELLWHKYKTKRTNMKSAYL